MADLYTTKAALVVGADLAQQQPLLAYPAARELRGTTARTSTRSPKAPSASASMRVRCESPSLPGSWMKSNPCARNWRSNGELVIVFGDTIKGDAVRRLVAFGDSLGIPVKYVCLVDYSNSRGASDMGLLPDLGPGYHPVDAAGLTLAGDARRAPTSTCFGSSEPIRSKSGALRSAKRLRRRA